MPSSIAGYRASKKRTAFAPWLMDNPTTGMRHHAYDDSFPLTFANLGSPELQEHHDAGELWAATLLTMNRRLGELLGDSKAGHRLGWQLVVDSLKHLTTGEQGPGFLDAKKALLTALDSLPEEALEPSTATNVRHTLERVFAHFGMGPNAHGPGATLQGEFQADFAMPENDNSES